MNCDVGEAKEGLEKKGLRMSCDVYEVIERLENELCHFLERFFLI